MTLDQIKAARERNRLAMEREAAEKAAEKAAAQVAEQARQERAAEQADASLVYMAKLALSFPGRPLSRAQRERLLDIIARHSK